MGVKIQFRDSENKLDLEMASKVFEWCKNQYEWFIGAESEEASNIGEFFCSNGEISINYGDGIFESEHPCECEDYSWLEEIYSEFTPYIMNAIIVQNEGCYYDLPHSYIEMQVRENDDGQRELKLTEDCAIDFGPGISTYTTDSPGGGWLKDQSMPFGNLHVRIKNKNTGEIKVLEQIQFWKNDDDEDELYLEGVKLVDSDGNSGDDWECIAGFEDKNTILENNGIDSEEEGDAWDFEDVMARNIFSDNGWSFPTA